MRIGRPGIAVIGIAGCQAGRSPHIGLAPDVQDGPGGAMGLCLASPEINGHAAWRAGLRGRVGKGVVVVMK